jgi:hypothetical protein
VTNAIDVSIFFLTSWNHLPQVCDCFVYEATIPRKTAVVGEACACSILWVRAMGLESGRGRNRVKASSQEDAGMRFGQERTLLHVLAGRGWVMFGYSDEHERREREVG